MCVSVCMGGEGYVCECVWGGERVMCVCVGGGGGDY